MRRVHPDPGQSACKRIKHPGKSFPWSLWISGVLLFFSCQSTARGDLPDDNTGFRPVWLNGIPLNPAQTQSPGQYPVESVPKHGLVQFTRPVKPGERRIYQQKGIQFLYYVPFNAYFITGPGEAMQQLRTHDIVAGLIPVPPAAKIDASIRILLDSPAGSRRISAMANPTVPIQLIFYPGTPFAAAQEILRTQGIIRESTQTEFDFQETLNCVLAPAHTIPALAAEDSVFMIGETDPPVTPLNWNAQWTSRIDEIHPGGIGGYNLDGAGVTVGMVDVGGVRTTHEQIRGRAFQVDEYPQLNPHSCRVAGTIAGSGEGNPLAQGMAPKATLLCWQQADDLKKIGDNAHRISASNHSYGNAAGWIYDAEQNQWHWYGNPLLDAAGSHLFGLYSMNTLSWDGIAYEHDLLIVAAAGNNREQRPPAPGASYILHNGIAASVERRNPGPETIHDYHTLTPIAGTKNGISVGSIYASTGQSREIDESCMTTFSSWGPTDDGRIKPDLVADGVNMLSMNDASDTDYERLGGTSMSSPVVTGAVACLTQLFRNRFQGADPAAAMMKGILIHTARHGGAGRRPNYRFGWGLLDARAAADFISAPGGEGAWLDMDAISDNSVEYECESNGQDAIKATLAWTDWPGIPTSGNLQYRIPNLVNDLDLSISGPDGHHYPWTLDPEHPADPAKQDQENRRDNVEQVYIATPAAGTYTIRVSGQVNQGGQQTYNLCVTGLRRKADRPTLCILKPFSQSLIEGVYPVQVLITGLGSPSRLQIRVDGKPWDDPPAPGLEGGMRIDPMEGIYIGALHWNTRLIVNGEHLLELIVTDSQGRACAKRLRVWIFNSGTELTVAGPLVTGYLRAAGQVDWYVLRIPESGFYTIETHPAANLPEVDTVLFLNGMDDDGGIEKYSQMTCELMAGRIYSVHVSGYENARGYYSIEVKPAPAGRAKPACIPLAIDGAAMENAFLDFGDLHSYVIRPEKMELAVIRIRAGDSPPEKFAYTLTTACNPALNETIDGLSQDLELILVKDCEYQLTAAAFKSKGHYTIRIVRVREAENKQLLIVDDPPLQTTFRPRMQYRFLPLESGNHILTIQPSREDGYVNFHARLYRENDFVNNLHRWFDSTRRTGYLDPEKSSAFVALHGWNHYYLMIESEKTGGTCRLQVRKAQSAELPVVAGRQSMSSPYQPGTPMDVTVQIRMQAPPGTGPSSAVLYEYCPSDWLPAGSRVYPYLPPMLRFRLNRGDSQSITYQLRPPDYAQGRLDLHGEIYFYTIEGINTIAVGGDTVLPPPDDAAIPDWSSY
ncbi:MAG: S8 family serine peptidase [bacterium]